MNLIDSSAWLEYFSDGRNARFFAPVIQDVENVVISTINIYEVYGKILTEKDESTALQAVGMNQQTKVVEVNSSIAVSAARLSFQHKLPLADSMILATARLMNAVVWTQDADFKNVSGVKYYKK